MAPWKVILLFVALCCFIVWVFSCSTVPVRFYSDGKQLRMEEVKK
jgi:hypothetical protein